MINKRIKYVLVPLITACIVLLIAVFIGRHAYRYYLAVTPQPYTTPAQTALLLKHEHDKQLACRHAEAPVVMIGSSTIEFWQREGMESWNRFFAPLQALNLGSQSDTTGNLLWRLQDGLLAPLNPKVIVLYIGVNNLGVHKCLGVVAYWGTQAVIRQLRQQFSASQTHILVIPPLIVHPNSRAAYFRDLLESRDLGENVHVVSLHPFFPAGGTAVYTHDGLHLNACGYHAIAEPLYRAIEQKLQQEEH